MDRVPAKSSKQQDGGNVEHQRGRRNFEQRNLQLDWISWSRDSRPSFHRLAEQAEAQSGVHIGHQPCCPNRVCVGAEVHPQMI